MLHGDHKTMDFFMEVKPTDDCPFHYDISKTNFFKSEVKYPNNKSVQGYITIDIFFGLSLIFCVLEIVLAAADTI